MEHLFIYLFAICTSSLVRYLFKSYARFLIGLFIFLLLSFKSSLCILDNSPLSDMSFANIYCLWLIFSLSTFHREGFNFNEVWLINSHFSQDCAFGITSKKSLPNLKLSRFSPMLSSRSFIALHFVFRSVIYFEFFFCDEYKVCV